MPKCSYCGHIAAWDSNACPRCGKRNPAGCAKAILAVVVILTLLVLCVLCSLLGAKAPRSSNRSRPNSVADVSYTPYLKSA